MKKLIISIALTLALVGCKSNSDHYYEHSIYTFGDIKMGVVVLGCYIVENEPNRVLLMKPELLFNYHESSGFYTFLVEGEFINIHQDYCEVTDVGFYQNKGLKRAGVGGNISGEAANRVKVY